jgi:hypothetical protein
MLEFPVYAIALPTIQIKVKDFLSVLLVGNLLSFLFYDFQHSTRHATFAIIV